MIFFPAKINFSEHKKSESLKCFILSLSLLLSYTVCVGIERKQKVNQLKAEEERDRERNREKSLGRERKRERKVFDRFRKKQQGNDFETNDFRLPYSLSL